MFHVDFDQAKDAANIAKHGLALARAAELDILAVVKDDRFSEQRYRIYGLLEGVPHCLAATLRNGVVRAISLRRAHMKEVRRYVP